LYRFNKSTTTTNKCNDSEDDDDPFGLNKNLPKFDNIASKQTVDQFLEDKKPVFYGIFLDGR
jgi:hypothetical protein